MNNFVTM